ncbi:hypothetical protein QYE87_24290, partial [Enterobacter hormaechei subsp. steigerwaltii]|nr:hypothetical protein [Enterobacter hormaechei subsp. steigerwaltii]
GAIPIGQGGTGATNDADARSNLGLGENNTANFGSLEIGAKKPSTASFPNPYNSLISLDEIRNLCPCFPANLSL